MKSNVEVLLEKCTEKAGWCHDFNLAWRSFGNNFEETKNDISFDEAGDVELVQIIKICDNRLARSKIFQDDAAVVFGFVLLSLSIFINMAGRAILLSNSIVGIVAALFGVTLIFLIFLLLRYRSDIHKWTVLKEIALMKQEPTQQDRSTIGSQTLICCRWE